ncbi:MULTISPECIES: hypothetical protein [unclassified Endozoicomonas]|uniref:hypothetical protein n=1 Tax=unclassified Endozoicomonas TaxID=2644528 RepID=UPI0021491DE8|nr:MULTISPECIES: hypothetical protein [unclassified Endozoicomonas]
MLLLSLFVVTQTRLLVTLGSGQDQQKGQPSEPSGRRASEVITQSTGSLNDLVCSGFGSGSGDPPQHSHTLGLNCFANPCHGICQFRPSSNSRWPDEWPLNSAESSCPHLADGHCFSCIGHFEPLNITQADYTTAPYGPLNLDSFHGESVISRTLTHSEKQQTTTASSLRIKSQIYLSRKGTIKALLDHRSE